MAFNANKCKLLRITYRMSSVIKYVYNMYQANAIYDNNSPLLALIAKKHLGFTVPTIDFIHIEETQHESYLGVIIDNKLNFDQDIDDMSKKAINLLNLCCRRLHTIKMISLKQDREEDHQRDGLPKYEKTRVYLS